MTTPDLAYSSSGSDLNSAGLQAAPKPKPKNGHILVSKLPHCAIAQAILRAALAPLCEPAASKLCASTLQQLRCMIWQEEEVPSLDAMGLVWCPRYN